MDWLAPLPVAVPLLAAAALTAFGQFAPPRVDDLTGILAAAASTVFSALLLAEARGDLVVHWFGGWRPNGGVALGISFVVDELGAGLALLAGVLVTASLVFAWRYFDEVGTLFHVLMLLFLAGMVGFVLSGDLFNMFVFFEVMGVSAYALTAYRIEDRSAVQGAINFAVVNSLGAFLLLIGIALLYGRTGALNLAQMGNAVTTASPDGLLVVAFALLATGFLVKAAAVPFHFWLADAYAVAPTTVCVVFAGVMSDLGIYALARIYWTVFSGPFASEAGAVCAVLLGAGILTALVGAAMCFLQRHLKRLLAFAVISHLGVFLSGVALLDPRGLAGAGAYVGAHGLLIGGLFISTGMLRRRAGSVDELALHGRGRALPVLRAVVLAGVVGLTGLPLLGVSLGHSLLAEGAHEAGYPWLPAVVTLAAAIVAGALLRAWARVFLGAGPRQDALLSPEPEEEESVSEEPSSLRLATATVLVAAGLLLPLAPGLPGQLVQAAERFQDRPAYAGAVLDGRPVPAETAVHVQRITLDAAFYGLAALAGGVLIATMALTPARRRLSGLGRRADPLVRGLRAVHSGHVGDYTAWFVFGTAVLGVLLSLGVH
jgi:multicomponent Na+:H+ antiporter subunit D